ncbi:MAG: hypothetical protein ABIG68_01345 [Acidobacteriota bacterium]
MESQSDPRGTEDGGYSGAAVFFVALAVGLVCFLYYFNQGLTTAHYDAKAHLVVARRLVDSQTPGYSQMGSHWLPLAHILYLPMVLLESLYRSAVLPSLLSVFSFAVSTWLVFRLSLRATGSLHAPLFASVILLANPNLQYLQSCPLTEPLYMMLSLLAVDALYCWRERGVGTPPWKVSLWTALACLCRYEGWYLLAGILLLLAWDTAAGRIRLSRGIRAALAVGASAAMPIALHLGYVYWRTGDSFFHRVARGYEAPYETQGRPLLSTVYHLGELGQVATLVVVLIGLAGTAVCLAQRRGLMSRLPLLLLWLPSLINVSALYWGLIYRVRYSVLLLPAIAVMGSLLLSSRRLLRCAIVGGALVVMALPWLSWISPREWRFHFLYPGPGIIVMPALGLLLLLYGLAKERPGIALCLLCAAVMGMPVLLGENRAVLREALEHEFIEPERRAVLTFLRDYYDGSGILIDMGRQAPLIYDSGLPVREFLYNEGDLSLWRRAMSAPHEVVGWMCAEKGDAVWTRLRVDPGWSRRYSVALQTENYLLYRFKP